MTLQPTCIILEGFIVHLSVLHVLTSVVQDSSLHGKQEGTIHFLHTQTRGC